MKGEWAMIIHRFLEKTVRNFPEKPFLYYGDQKITFRELDAISDRLAYSFLNMGIVRGDRIAIIAPN